MSSGSTIALDNIAIFLVIIFVLSVVIFHTIQSSGGQTQIPANEIVKIKIGASIPNLQSSILASYEPANLPTNKTGPGLPVNTTVIWKNEDESFHTVTSGDVITGPDKKFDSGILPPKFNWNHTFNIPGNYSYYCTIHPYMDGSVRVVSPIQN